MRALPGGETFRAEMNALEDSVAQIAAVERFFDTLNEEMDRIPVDGGQVNENGRDNMMEYAA